MKTVKVLAILLNPLRVFDGLDPKEFLNVYQEWHALVEGVCEVVCPWRACYEPSEELLNDIKNEHHYYMAGRALGILVWLGIIKIVKEIIFG